MEVKVHCASNLSQGFLLNTGRRRRDWGFRLHDGWSILGAMAIRVARQLAAGFEALRFEPVEKRIRAMLGERPAADTTGAVLVWEPSRVVPQYAIPVDDVLAALVPAGPDDGDRSGPGKVPGGPGGREMLTPGTGFAVHTTGGEALSVRLRDATRRGAAFRPDDADLHGYVLLDFSAFDTWLEEDEEIVSHPRDPFHRVDARRSSREVRVELDGHLLAESVRPTLVFETSLPVRYYLPADDIVATLRASSTTTACAYKGVATYQDVVLPDRVERDLVWSYASPLPDAAQLADLVCFYSERVDLVVDGVRKGRPTTEWSSRYLTRR
jgi:uncharacterized protein (DUF427 family)